ncbi:MAG: MBL fold metallo-hydrolase, partial [Lentisphaerae bacterium]|nr:MBL fold metallo-hydrolase [Lentisphaerota bacterium]
GLLPKLAKTGFKGDIYGTGATVDIAKIVMMDSAKIQEEDAEKKRRRHEKQGRTGPFPVAPLYTQEDVELIQSCMKSTRYDEPIDLGAGVVAYFNDVGHILGSSSVKIVVKHNGEETSVLFSGDVGRWNTPILRDPVLIEKADYVIVESTYGNRTHKDNDTISEALATIVNETRAAGGHVVVPSFAVERTQELLYRLNEMLAKGMIEKIPIFLDSPMAIRVTEVFERHPECFDNETMSLIRSGHHPCDLPGLTLSRSVDESKAINEVKEPAIIIAGSGMCTGGRIKHHLRNHISRPESTILFVGYQAVGTLGRIILEGEKEVRIHGENYAVKARIKKINGFSAHGDRNELLRWLSGLKNSPKRVFVTHGEPDAANAFAAFVKERKGWSSHVPTYGDEVVLENSTSDSG